jgi:hypothetical protein
MTEGKLLAPCLKMMRAELAGFVIIKHADGSTSGVPDVSVTHEHRTSWWEFKHGSKIKWAHGLQQLTCKRLAAHGFACHVVLYQEKDQFRSTVILTPDEIVVGHTPGFNHRFVADFVRNLHAA